MSKIHYIWTVTITHEKPIIYSTVKYISGTGDNGKTVH